MNQQHQHPVNPQGQHHHQPMNPEHPFLIFLRTKQFFMQRLRNVDDFVFITPGDLQRFNVTPALLNHWLKLGAIEATETRLRVLQSGRVDLELLKPKGAPETSLHKWMKQVLIYVNLPKEVNPTDYWKAFILYRHKYLDHFFTVDSFSGRVHTPVSSLHRELRPYLILCGEPVASLDVSQMQPTLLAMILHNAIGKNTFSDAIHSGKDIYTMLQQSAGLQTREEAKKRFFEILFSKPNRDLSALFDGSDWIDWINDYKSRPEPVNPHSATKPHSNLAWLLQSTEVRIMTAIWQKLAEAGLPFLSVHDEIICRAADAGRVESIMNCVLSDHFRKFKLNSK